MRIYPSTPTSTLLFTIAMMLVSHTIWAQQYIPFIRGNKWGYADTNGKVVIAPQWGRTFPFSNGRAKVWYTDEDRTTCLIDTAGNYLIPPWRKWTGELFPSICHARLNVCNGNDRWGIADSNGRIILSCQYQRPEPYSEPHFEWNKGFNTYTVCARQGNRVGMIDTAGRVLIPFIYYRIHQSDELPDRFFRVGSEEGDGVIDTGNKVIVPFQQYFMNVWPAIRQQYCWMQQGQRRFLADTFDMRLFADRDSTHGAGANDTIVLVLDKGRSSTIRSINGKVLLSCEDEIAPRYFTTTVGLPYSNEIYDLFNRYSCNKDLATWQKAIPGFMPRPSRWVGVYAKRREDSMRENPWVVVRDVKDGVEWEGAYTSYPVPVTGTRHSGGKQEHYVSVIDSVGHFLLRPVQGYKDAVTLNYKDRLFFLRYTKDPVIGDIVDSTGHVLVAHIRLPQAAFCYNGKLYYIQKKEKEEFRLPYVSFWHNEYRSRRSYFPQNEDEELPEPYGKKTACWLIGADGNVVKGWEHYDVLAITDSLGIGRSAYTPTYLSVNWFPNTFAGYLWVKDHNGKLGILRPDGSVVLPGISFKFERLKALGHGLFLEGRNMEDDEAPSLEYGTMQYQMPLKEEPYLINSEGKILLDSLSIGDAWPTAELYGRPMLKAYLRKSMEAEKEVYIYVDEHGRGFYSDLPRYIHTEHHSWGNSRY